jgi:hypothetical protein
MSHVHRGIARSGGPALALIAALSLGGCCARSGSSLAPAYSSLRRVLVQAEVAGEPSLLLAEPDHDSDLARFPDEARSFMATRRSRRDVAQEGSRDRMRAFVEDAVVEQLQADHRFEVVTDRAQPHDAVLLVEVRRFGLENDLDQTRLTSFYRVRASLRDARPAGGVLLWRRCGRDRSAVEPPPRAAPDPDEGDDGERVVDDGAVDLRDLRALAPGEVAFLFRWVARDIGRFVSQALAQDARAAGR